MPGLILRLNPRISFVASGGRLRGENVAFVGLMHCGFSLTFAILLILPLLSRRAALEPGVWSSQEGQPYAHGRLRW